jgi:hypothetical protein
MSTSTPTEPTTATDVTGRPIETAPSAVYAEAATFTRMAGMVGLGLFVLGAAVVIATKATGQARFIPEGWAYLFAALGIVLMLYHSVRDTEAEVRRLYGLLGGAWLLFGLAAALIPGPVFEKAAEGATKQVGFNLLPWGVGGGLLGLLFLIPFARNETDEAYRRAAVVAMLAIGGVLALGSLVFGAFKPDFLAGPGLALALLGLGFLCAYFGQVDTSEGTGYAVAFGLGALGAVVALAALVWSAAPTLLYEGPNALRRPNGSIDAWKAAGRGVLFAACLAVAAVGLSKKLPGWARAAFAAVGLVGVILLAVATLNSNTITVPPSPFLVPTGIIYMGIGLLYLGVALGICSDNQFVTLTRRELAAYFLSPVGYLVLGGMAVAQWQGYLDFLNTLSGRRTLPEPIVQYYYIALLPVFGIILEIPALTMRLMAEEKRTGTLEVLLTAPVNEPPIILSKFLATWLFFLVTWLPAALYLIALRVETGTPFDYRPLLSFNVALAAQGAAFIGLGLFYSTITRNQIVAAVLMFVTMAFFLFCYMLREEASPIGLPQFVQVFFGRLSFIHMWRDSLSGQLPLRDLLLWLSLAVFALFLSVKVLETRKWS